MARRRGRGVYFDVDVSDARNYFRQLGQQHGVEMQIALANFNRLAPQIVEEIFIREFPADEKVFPTLYKLHILTALRNTDVIVYDLSQGLDSVKVDLSRLGDWRDFKRGWHYKAKLASGGFVNLPYNNQRLKNSPSIRTQFWNAILEGKSRVYVGKGKWIKVPEGAFDETIKARVDVWGEKAPEWLLLEFGSNGSPSIEPRFISTYINTKLSLLFDDLMEDSFRLAKEQAKIAGGKFSVTRKGNIQGASGKFITKAR